MVEGGRRQMQLGPWPQGEEGASPEEEGDKEDTEERESRLRGIKLLNGETVTALFKLGGLWWKGPPHFLKF